MDIFLTRTQTPMLPSYNPWTRNIQRTMHQSNSNKRHYNLSSEITSIFWLNSVAEVIKNKRLNYVSFCYAKENVNLFPKTFNFTLHVTCQGSGIKITSRKP